MEIIEENKNTHLFHYNPIWNDINKENEFLSFIYNNSDINIILDNTDDSYVFFKHNNKFWKKVDEIVKKNKIKLYIINIGNQIEKSRFNNFFFISFPLAHLFGTHDTLLKARHNYDSNILLHDEFNPKYFIKCLNRQPHHSRCLMVDELAKHKLLNNMILLTWNFASNGGYYNHKKKHNFKYWKEEILTIDNPNNWHEQYTSNIIDTNNSLIHLVGETQTNNIGFTEKTWKPILNNEIFLLYGVKNQNTQLKSYGFKLFDEIFDYTFDQKKYTDAIPDIVDQISKIKFSDANEIYHKVKETIIHNHNNAIDILNNKKYIPSLINSIKNLTIHSMSYNLIPILTPKSNTK